MTMGYSEIPGVLSETPKSFPNARRQLRKYRWCLTVVSLVAIVILAAVSLSILIGSSLKYEGPANDRSSRGDESTSRTDMLLKLNWPRQDDSWYAERWRDTHLLCPLANSSETILCSEIPGYAQGEKHKKPTSTRLKRNTKEHDGSTFPPWDHANWNRIPAKMPACSVRDIGEAMAHGSRMEESLIVIEEEMNNKNLTLKPNTSSYRHQVGFQKTCPLASKRARNGYKMEHATTYLAQKHNISKNDIIDSMWIAELKSTPYCEDIIDIICQKESPYRNVDGTCNNLLHPQWGRSLSPFRRALPPDYADGVSVPRKSQSGHDLPNARLISKFIHLNVHRESDSYTHLLMSWGQFVDHDITATASSKGKNGQSLQCCSNKNEKVHPECIPIQIPKEDVFYMGKNVSCLELMRSAPASTCQFGPRQQLNQLTHYLDGSTIYGSTDEQLNELRAHTNGLIKTQVTIDGRELLQASYVANDSCNTQQQMKWNQYCFKSGDARVNEHILLTIMHTIWTREHNRIASTLYSFNPDWTDEKLFQESRRIVVAQIQHITYHEFLPSILGPHLSKELKLSPLVGSKRWDDYDQTINPGISNGFAAAAYRFGHSMIRGLLQKIDSSGSNVQFEQMQKFYFHPFSLYDPGTMEEFVRGQISQKCSATDSYFTKQISEHLFETKSNDHGLDLVAINIQRGRDHGIPGYTRWRMYCGLPEARNFSDLRKEFDVESLQRISNFYESVDDIDLYTGGLSEIPLKDSLVGPTFACIIADQFLRLKKGDRFWYETSVEPQAFTEEQLLEIRKISLSRILCNNVEGIRSIQRWPFRHFETGNPRTTCTSGTIPEVDLWPWEEGSL